MNNSNTQNERIAKITFARSYPMYLAKVEKKADGEDFMGPLAKPFCTNLSRHLNASMA